MTLNHGSRAKAYLINLKVLFIKKIKDIFHNNIDRKEIARSVAVGVFVALTPTFGIQIILILLIWNITRLINRLKFNLSIALSLTFITNYLTVIPYYYLCYHTGLKIFRTGSVASKYSDFAGQWSYIFGNGFFHAVSSMMKMIPETFIAVLIGSSVYAVLASILMYYFVFYQVIRLRQKE